MKVILFSMPTVTFLAINSENPKKIKSPPHISYVCVYTQHNLLGPPSTIQHLNPQTFQVISQADSKYAGCMVTVVSSVLTLFQNRYLAHKHWKEEPGPWNGKVTCIMA